MYTQAVLANLIVSRHDTALTDALVGTLDDNAWRATIIACGMDLVSTHHTLIEAARGHVREQNETSAARAKLTRLTDYGINWYTYAYGHSRQRLTNPPPEANLTVDDIDANQKKFDRMFKFNPSKLTNLGTSKILEIIDPVFKETAKEPELKDLAASPTTKKNIEGAFEALTEFEKETGEDKEAAENLNDAVENHQLAQELYELAVTGALKSMKRQDEMGKWLLEKDPAYRARRLAKSAITQEPEASPIIAEIGTEPIDIEPTAAANPVTVK